MEAVTDRLAVEQLIVLGIAEGDQKIGRLVASPVNPGSRLQLHRVTVHIENVIRGDVPERDITLYYFAFEFLNTSHHPLIFGRSPSRRLIAMRRDGGVYRAAVDGWNCAPRIVTGAHPDYKPDPGASTTEYEAALSLTRGKGPVEDSEFAEAIRMSAGAVPDRSTVEKLGRLVVTESGKVRNAACVGLRHCIQWGDDEGVRARATTLLKAGACQCRGDGVAVVCE